MGNQYVKMVVHCANCNRQKGEANHWFVLSRPNAYFRPRSGVVPKIYDVHGFDFVLLDENAMPLCGEECLQKIEAKLRAEFLASTTKVLSQPVEVQHGNTA